MIMKKLMMLLAGAAAMVSAPAMATATFGYTATNPLAVPADAVLTFDGITSYNATDTGWYSAVGDHDATNPNYAVGDFDGSDHRDYFSFLVGAAAPVSPYTTATLTIRNGDSLGTFPATYSLFDVSATPAQVDTTRNSGDATGLAIYADLGSGTSYGSYTFSTAPTNGAFTTISLNQAFINQVNSGLLLNFSIGGTITEGAAVTPPVTSAVPEPATWAMMMLGVGIVGASLRRRQRVTTRVKFA